MTHQFYRNRLTGKILAHAELLEKYPNTSFPVGAWPKSVFDFIECDPVIETSAPPAPDEYTVPIPDGYEQIDGVWQTKWKFQDRFSTEDEKLQFINGQIEDKWNSIREQRNQFLRDTDYTQISDFDLSLTDSCKIEFQEYRQQLRDITQQPDPFKIVWPEEPVCRYK